jgi:hypothetical protein
MLKKFIAVLEPNSKDLFTIQMIQIGQYASTYDSTFKTKSC